MKTLTQFSMALLLVSTTLFAKDVYATFNVKANKEAVLAFTASGTINKRYVEVGSIIKKGDVLASLDNSEQKMILALAKEDLANANIQAKQSLNSFNRYKKVKDILDKEKYEQIIFSKKMTQNSAKKAMLNVRLRQAQLNKTILRAPFNAVVTQSFKELGDSVTGMQVMPVFEVMDISDSKLVLEFDERYWDVVKAGQIFTFSVDGSKENFSALIHKVYPSANSKNRKIKAEVMTKNLKPGLFGQGLIKID